MPPLPPDPSLASEEWARGGIHPGAAPGPELGGWAHPRFEPIARLGRGGFGTVFSARDRERGEVVAVKVLRRGEARHVEAFRREFRELAQLTHPRLPVLYEFFSEPARHFFTMEWVVGTPVARWVRHQEGPERAPTPALASTTWTDDGRPSPGVTARAPAAPAPPVDHARVLDAVAQLREALAWLHRRGWVHGDVKPSNVLVREGGQLVLLDFGLVQRVGAARAGFAGTPRHAAPEVGLSAAAPAEDVYALGSLAFELTTGEAPFAGESHEVLAAKRARPAPELASCAPGAPAELAALVDRWLQRDPDARGAFTDGEPAHELAGRGRELAALDAALARAEDGHALEVVGPAGLGKSTLLAAWAERAATRAHVVRGGASGRERGPYGTLAPLVELVDPRGLPSFTSHAALAEAIGDALAERARERPVCVLLDDLHAAAPDALAVLERLLRPPRRAGVLFVLARRPHEPGHGRLSLPLPLPALTLSTLDDADADALLERRGVEASRRRALVARSLGHPYFLSELAAEPGEAPLSLGALLDARVAALPPLPRAVLDAVCLAARPVSASHLVRVVPDVAGQLSPCLERLVRGRLARTVEGTGALAPHHDLVRERVLARLGAEARRALHERFCEALEAGLTEDRAALVEHLVALDRGAEAAEVAERAADDARAAGAFARGAELCTIALRATTDPDRRTRLLRRLVDLSEQARRGVDGLEALDELAARATDPAERTRLASRAAYHALCAGRVEEGHRRLQRQLEALGLSWPGSTAATLARIARIELGLPPRRALPHGPAARHALDLCAEASNALAMIDNPRARILKDDAVTLARRIAPPLERAEHLLRDAFYLTALSPRSRRRMAARLAEVDALTGPEPPARLGALRAAAVAIAAFQAGGGRDACEALAHAEDAVARAAGPTDNTPVIVGIILGHALRMQGELAWLDRHVERVLAQADERGNGFLRFTALFGGNAIWLARGAPEVSRHRLETLRWSTERGAFHVQEWLRAEAEIETSLYEGDARGGLSRLGATLRDLLTSTLRQLESVRVSSDAAVGRLLLAARDDAPARGRDALWEHALLSLVTERLARSDAGPARLRGALLRAGRAAILGRRDEASAALEHARAHARALGHRLLDTLAEVRLDQLAGRGIRDGARATLAELGVATPERYVRVEIPGFSRWEAQG